MRDDWNIVHGDALLSLREIADSSINCCVTSPPYFGLIDYGVKGQIGLESSLDRYIENLVDVFGQVRRVLRKDGTLWLNVGDCYSKRASDGCKTKDLLGVPWKLAFALRSDGWYLRQEIIWHKPNAMPSSVNDRPTSCHEQIFLLSKSSKYYYDHESVKEPAVSDHPSGNGFKRTERLSYRNSDGTARGNDKQWAPVISCERKGLHSQVHSRHRSSISGGQSLSTNPNGLRNRRDVWTIPTKPFRGAHFAVMPEAVAEPCVLAGCPKDGVVLDPFAGSGTVGVVALRHGRKFVGVELNADYIEIAKERIVGSQKLVAINSKPRKTVASVPAVEDGLLPIFG